MVDSLPEAAANVGIATAPMGKKRQRMVGSVEIPQGAFLSVRRTREEE